MKKSLAVFTAVALSIGAASLPLTASASLPVQVDGQTLPSLAPMLQKVTPSVVNIMVSGTQVSKQRLPEQFKFFFGPDLPDQRSVERPFQGLGSGVIIDKEKGYIVTNAHVVDHADNIKIQLTDGREFSAKKIGQDTQSDIALLQVDAEDLTEVQLADSDNLHVGDFSVAIGNPFGLGQTVTSGIISALGRNGLNIENYENFIQTDAAINRGNSGGALVNLRGELIGINTAILGPGGGNVGIGFAIPSNMVQNLVDQLIEFGEVRRGQLGVYGKELTAGLAKAFGQETRHGAFIQQVIPESAAEKAGLKAGDIITRIDGKQIRTFGELRAKIATLGAGKKVELGFIRDGDAQTVIVTLGSSSQKSMKADDLHPALEGVKLENATGEIEGIRVNEVTKGSPAARLGLKEDDIIIGVNRQRVDNLGDLRRVLEEKPEVLALNILRGGMSLYIVVN